jgi:hypothetical protein
VQKPIRIGMTGGEVGYITLPMLTTLQNRAGDGYVAQIEIETELQNSKTNKPLDRAKDPMPKRVRDENGGLPFEMRLFSESSRKNAEMLRALKFTGEKAPAPKGLLGGGSTTKAAINVPFSMLPPAIASLPGTLKPEYVPLWTAKDHRETGSFQSPGHNRIVKLLPLLNRHLVFFPLLKTTQYHFENAGFRLWAGECVMITKLLAFALETGPMRKTLHAPDTEPQDWYLRLTEVAVKDPSVGDPQKADRTFTEVVYFDLLRDAAILGFNELSKVTSEEFGTKEEIMEYADNLIKSVQGTGHPLDFTHVYLPLVLGGRTISRRVLMPDEEYIETFDLMDTAMRKRGKNDDNSFIFDMVDGMQGQV